MYPHGHISVGESRQKEWKFFSRTTEFVEGVGHSHVFVSWKDQYGNRWVAEAHGSGIRLLSNEEFKRHSEVVNIYHYPYDDAARHKEIIRYIWKQSAKKYGSKQILGLLLMRAGNAGSRAFTGRNHFKNPFRDGDASQICCEFALKVAALSSADVAVPRNLESFGLIEARRFNELNGKKQPQSLINRINRKVA